MPREPTNGGPPKSSASASTSDAHKQDDSRKRTRAPASCAGGCIWLTPTPWPPADCCPECRRLKLKCDKRWPCSSCSKRGCAAICPNGAGMRACSGWFILAGTEHLHEKIDIMSRRISELEVALAALQAQISSVKHPLLADELLTVKEPIATQDLTAAAVDSTDTDLVIDHLGTLTLGEREHFYGQHAAADYLLPDACAREPPLCRGGLPFQLRLLDGTFPLAETKAIPDEVLQRILQWLPPAEDAWAIVEIYYRDAAWLSDPISREEFKVTIFSRVYAGGAPTADALSAHELAILLTILAIGCMVDVNRPPYNQEASKFYHLGRLALGMDSILDHPTVQGIRAMHMMALLLQMCDHTQAATSSYSIVGLNMQLCQSLGLHRDAGRWNLCEVAQCIRRRLFWEVAASNCWLGITFGRPSNLSLSQVDTKLPYAQKDFSSADGHGQSLFAHWVHTFTSQVMSKVMDEAFGVTSPTYATILRLDKLVREHPVHERLRIVDVGMPMPDIPTALLLQRNAVFSLTQQLLLLLHRSSFSRAIVECPADPLKGKHSQSVLAAFRAAFYLTASVRALYAQAPIALRFWVFWSHTFSACLVLATLVIRAPASCLAPPAWVELDRMAALFEAVAPASRRIARVLPAMRLVHAHARAVHSASAAPLPPTPHGATPTKIEREICFMLGQTRLIREAGTKWAVPMPVEAYEPSWSSSAGSGSGSGPASASASVSPPAPVAGPSSMLSPPAAIFPSADSGSSATGSCATPDELLAALYSSLWPSAAGEAQPQQDCAAQCAWDPEAFAQAPQDPLFELQSLLNAQMPPFEGDFGLSSGLSAPNAPDDSWQRILEGFGVDVGQQLGQDNGASGAGGL
ncbi:hypothetical protein AURDEDRAFT_92952 [Auricularia subglabra TFB-10046 SS5]|uniref:Zn(2)-C6 fungal-type domain-containing protein n=1 Tax=Auricularia subglabra (strain TFB-10046 / SS5) TaxID=717982 RepID=J0WS81_AURST|nr:hypothetical protein AURDEDRAFT_92952 [Auricularia subglabra TFB-10046 SS5]